MPHPPFGFIVGHKWFATCGHCEQTIRVDKPLFGLLHICLTDEELAAKRYADALARQQQNTSHPTTPWDMLRGLGAGLGPLPESVVSSLLHYSHR